MPRGSNPRSRNNPSRGEIKKLVRMPDRYWQFCTLLGAGNQNEGIREAVRAMQILADIRLKNVSKFLCCNASSEAIQIRLLELFPDLDTGRKTSADLLSELMLGECQLINDGSRVYRLVHTAIAYVPSPIQPNEYLYELRQEWGNGRIVERNIEGVAGKVQGDENPLNAICREVHEELGIVVQEEQFEYLGDKLKENPGSAYNGIVSQAKLYKFQFNMCYQQWAEEYREVKPSKTTVFGWKLK